MITLQIAPQDSGKKLHRYVRQMLPGMPLSGIYKMIRVGRIKVNGAKGKMESVLHPGDELSIYIHEEEYKALAKPVRKFGGVKTDVEVVYEDSHLLILNKPVGLLTHPDSSEHKDTLIGRALAYLHQKGEIADGRSFLPATVNRLDRNTSGIVIIGKDSGTLRAMAEMIREHQLEKTYIAVVWGTVRKDGQVLAPLVKSSQEVIRSRVTAPNAPGARQALTRYRVLGVSDEFSLLEVLLITGRMHQIRAHMQSIGHPLVGDLKYGGKSAFHVNHQLLHAYSIRLPDGRRYVAALPKEFQDVLRQAHLSQYAPDSLNTH